MSMATEKRTLDPEQIHQLWLSLINLLKQFSSPDEGTATGTSAAPALSSVSISSLSAQLKGDKTELSTSNKKGADAFESTVQQALKEGLLVLSNSSAGGGGLTNGTTTHQNEPSVSLPLGESRAATSKTATNGFSPHDWYCFGCHLVTGKQLIECNQCWRVYHSACVQSDYDFAVKLEPDSQASTSTDSSNLVIRARSFICPICTLSQKFANYTVGSRLFSQAEFNQILGYTYQAFKSKSSQISRNLLKLKDLTQSPLSVSSLFTCLAETSSQSTTNTTSTSCELTTQLALQYLSYKSVDLGDIEAKLEQSGYQSLGEFLGDCLAFKHMIEVAVVAGTDSDASRRRIRDTLTRMLDACRYDLKEMLGCIDCYRNSNRYTEDKFWFCRPCDPPHMLVFAKQKGYPFWPAKVINPRTAQDRDTCTEFDVRFFGAQHERCIADQSNIKDINSSLSELCISKANSSLEKALAELRVHRELLEKFEKGMDTDLSPDEHVDGHKVLVKRKYNRRQNVPPRKRSNSNSSANLAIRKKTDKSDEVVGKAKNKRSRVNNRRYTTESDATVAEKVDSDSEQKSAHMSESEHESEDIFEDAKEEMSQVNDIEDDAATDVDEELLRQQNEQVRQEKATALPAQPKVRRVAKKKIAAAIGKGQPGNSTRSVNQETTNVKRPRGRPRKHFNSPVQMTECAPSTSANATSEAPNPTNPTTPKKGRIRRNKILYSPVQTPKASKPMEPLSLIPPAPEPQLPAISPPVRVSARGRKPKSFSNRSPSPVRVSSPPIDTVAVTSSGRGRPRGRGRGKSSSPRSPTRNPVKSPDLSQPSTSRGSHSASRVNRKLSLSPSPVRPPKSEKKVTEKSQRRKQNIEAQRQLIQARRKKTQQKVSIVPKHIPPVTATKSSPAFSVAPSVFSKSITSPTIVRPLQKPLSLPLNHIQPSVKPLLSPNPLSGVSFSPNGFNSPLFSFASQNGFINSNFPQKPTLTSFAAQIPNRVPQQSQLPPPPLQSALLKPAPSSVLKPLTNGEEASGSDTNDSTTVKLQNGQFSIETTIMNGDENDSNLNNVDVDEQQPALKATVSNDVANNLPPNMDVDDDDDEPYMYDDEQLEEQINEYVTYQEEKEQFERQQMQLQLYQQQQQLIQQQQMLQHMQQQQQRSNQVAYQNGCAHHLQSSNIIGNNMPPPPSPAKSKLFLEPPPKKYLEYSSSCIYSPTKMNQNLVNHYLHQYSTNTFTKNDYLAQLVLRKDEFEQMDQAADQPPPANRKRGRPPKTATDDVTERSGKAKSIVEKSYLQESACDRACLMKNIKTFKRFREFVETQHKEEITKFKREVEQLKQEVYRLKNQKEELEGDLKRERENSKRCDPQLLLQLQARHRREITDIKRKQWCISCEAEASYFCCYNTNYCSPECQHKHWFAGHKGKCGRNRANNNNNGNNGSNGQREQPVMKSCK